MEKLFFGQLEWNMAEAHLSGDDAENVRWLSGGVSTIETVSNWIIRMRQEWENDGLIYCFIIFDATMGQQVGMIDGNANSEQVGGLQAGEVNISYNIYPAFRGKGYATKGVNLIQTFFKQKGFTTALIRVNPENITSLRVANRAGFTKTGENSPQPNEEKLIIFKKQIS